jgi:uncharacterized membrane protein YdfJ with MMPL/SSD domain
MKPVAWMAGAGGVSWFIAAMIVDQRTGIEVLFGMLGPLAATTGTWVLAERIYRHRAQALTTVMATAFVAKIVFFGAYIAVMLLGLRFRPVPFVLSFTGYFIALYLMEALFLRRLFSERSR